MRCVVAMCILAAALQPTAAVPATEPPARDQASTPSFGIAPLIPPSQGPAPILPRPDMPPARADPDRGLDRPAHRSEHQHRQDRARLFVVPGWDPYWGPPSSAPPFAYWLYCQNPAGFYPYIQECPSGWLPVVPPDGE